MTKMCPCLCGRVSELGETSHDKARGHVPQSAPLYLCRRCLGLWEPENHLHSAVHFESRRQCDLSLLALADRGIQRTETAVAVGLEGTHAQLFGERYGLLVGGCGRLDLQGSALRSDLTVQPQGVCLIGLLLGVTGACQGTLGKLVRLLQTAGQERRFTEMGGPERIQAYGSPGSQLYGLREQWLGRSEAARQ